MRIASYAPAFCLFACICTIPGLAPGAEPPLSAEAAVMRAVANSPELSADKEETRGLQEAAERLPLLANPILELEGTSGALTNSPDEKAMAISLSQEIPLLPTGNLRKSVARAETELMRARISEQERLLADQVRQTWLDVALSGRRLELARSQQAIAESLLFIAKTRFQAGDLPELEVQLAELDLRRSELRQRGTAADVEQARRRLALLLGLNGPESLPSLDRLPDLPASLPADEKLLTAALAHRPDLLVRHREAEREAAGLSLARAEVLPALTVALSYRNERSSQNSYALNGGVLVPGKEQTSDHLVGLKLSIPLPLFSRNQAELARATARVSAARQRLEGGRRAVSAELHELLSRYRLTLSALQLHRTTVGPMARENLKIQQEAFRLGETGLQTVLDEKRRLAEQQELELAALQAAHTTYSRLESAVGGPLAQPGGKP